MNDSRVCNVVLLLKRSLSFLQSKRRSQGLSLDAVYHCLNRTILYQFSRAHKTVPQQVALLDSLRVLTVNRNLILGPGNHDQEFISCLAHCLINLHAGSSVEGFGLEAEARMTTWHIMIPSDIEPDGGYSQDISEGNLPSQCCSFVSCL